jgi:hypothetical protein
VTSPGRLGAAAVAASLIFGVAPSGAKAPTCPVSGGRVIAADAAVRVYKLKTRVYACSRRSKKAIYLGSTSANLTAGEEVRNVRAAGRFVAYEHSYGGRGGERYYVVVVDVVSRRSRAYATGARPPSDVINAGIGPTTDIALTTNGSVAWIARVTYSPDAVYEVHAVAARGVRRQLLDRSRGIAAGSLATSNPVIYWLKDGVAQSGRF